MEKSTVGVKARKVLLAPAVGIMFMNQRGSVNALKTRLSKYLLALSIQVL
jgi:hypothetical protein